MPAELKVLTYNIHKGFSVGNRRFVLHAIREALLSSHADLLFLQEAQGEHNTRAERIEDWPSDSQLEFLADQAWPHHVYARNAVYAEGHHGNAILSRFPITDWENINVSLFRKASRSVLHGTIRIDGSRPDLHVICIHFGLLGLERRVQVNILCDRIESHVPAGAPLLVAGDFNDWLGRAERRLRKRLGLREVFQQIEGRNARSWPAWMPLLRMDRIYYRGLEARGCERLAQAPWHRLSDHAPLSATFALRNGADG